MKLQIMSDVHLDVRYDAPRIPGPDWHGNPPDVAADVLVLAGDVGNGAQGVLWAVREAERLGVPCVYVAGNHEFFYHEVGAAWRAMREAAYGTRVHVLENEAVVIDGVRFLGTTLWTALTAFRPDPVWLARHRRWDPVADARDYMGDYDRVEVLSECGQRSLDPTDTVRWHRKAVAFLERELASPFDGPTVVITHHAPSELSRKRKYGPRLAPHDNTYWTPLEHLFEPERMALWAHGHTHVALDAELYGVRLVSNPLGYRMPYARTGYEPGKLFEV